MKSKKVTSKSTKKLITFNVRKYHGETNSLHYVTISHFYSILVYG